MNLSDADKYAAELLAAIQPFCVPDRCMVVGSVRRRVPQPNDVELIAIPITTDFDKLDGLRKIVNGGRFGSVEVGAFPSRYTRLRGPHCKLDLFWNSRESYGLNTFIRTGSASFATAGLVHWKKITNGGYSEGAILHLADGTPVKTWVEEEVFEALKCKWIPPEKRNRD